MCPSIHARAQVLTIWTLHSLRKIYVAFEEFQSFLRSEVGLKKAELAKSKQFHHETTASSRNLFSRMVLASEEEGLRGLRHDELIGNLFVYLFAGVSRSRSIAAFWSDALIAKAALSA